MENAQKSLAYQQKIPFYFNKEKLFVLYDVPHFFKSIRNSLLNANFLTPDVIKEVYELEKRNFFSLAVSKSNIRLLKGFLTGYFGLKYHLFKLHHLAIYRFSDENLECVTEYF